MSFFKNLLTNKSVEHPLDTKISGLSKESVETNPRMKRLNSTNMDETPTSNRTKTMKEQNKYLNLVNQELNNENETLKEKIDDLKISVMTNKQLLEDFIASGAQKDRTIKILKSRVELMVQKLKENNIDYEEHLDISFTDKQ